MDKVRSEILSKMIPEYKTALNACSFHNLQEIRFRADRPVMLYYGDRTSFLRKEGGETDAREQALAASQEDIARMVGAFCRSSVYAYQEEIKGGFITIRGGHRIGISGRAVAEGGKVINIGFFSGLNIRLAREFPHSADGCMKHICAGNRIYNSIIISPPGVGRTTVLRDCARQLSSRFKVVIVDERSELAACGQGVPQFDVGEQTDVLDGFPKPEGITHALRSLSPDVIITDEIGTEADAAAVGELLKGGCKIITSMHGYSIDEALAKKRQLMKLFETAILLGRNNGKAEVQQCLKLWELQ